MTPADLSAVMEATWPPAGLWRQGPWTIRDGAGGGKRVSAATAAADWTAADVPAAAAAMRGLGQEALFCIHDGDDALDAELARQGYRVVDPVVLYAGAVAAFDAPAPMTTFPHWPPLAIVAALWSDAGTDPARLAVMHRVQGPRAAILSRSGDLPAGVGFVACHQGVAMLHAVEVAPACRRQGCGHNILRAAAQWGAGQGARTLALAVTRANGAARGLYASAGMQVVGQYHYRQLPA